MTSSSNNLTNIWGFVEELAVSKNANDRVYAAVVMKEIYNMTGRLVKLNTDDEPMRAKLLELQQKIKDRIEMI